MLDLDDPKTLYKNPLVTAELFKYLSPYELLKVFKKTLDEHDRSILDQEAVVKAIIDCEEKGKLLILLNCSDVRMSGKTEELIDMVFTLGTPYQAALFSNVRVDWYLAFSFNNVISKYLSVITEDNGELSKAFYSNPRMDRTLIGNIIRGKEIRNQFEYDFSKIPFPNRIRAAYYALPVEEIPAIDWPGKDMPDSHELHFKDAVESTLVLLLDIWKSGDKDAWYGVCNSLIWQTKNTNFSIHADDFLDDSENLKIKESCGGDWRKEYDVKKHESFKNILAFFDLVTKDIKSDADYLDGIAEYGELKYYSPALLLSTIIKSLLSSYSYRDNYDSYIDELINHPNWVLRVAGYQSIFSQIKIDTNTHNDVSQFLNLLSSKHDISRHVIIGSSLYYIIRSQDYDSYKLLTDYIDRSQPNKCMEKYYRNFDYLYDETSYANIQDLVSKHNIRCVKPISQLKLKSQSLSGKIGGIFGR